MMKIWIDMVLCSVTWRITQLPNNRKKYFYGVSPGKKMETQILKSLGCYWTYNLELILMKEAYVFQRLWTLATDFDEWQWKFG